MVPPFLLPFAVGVIAAPLVGKIAKPLLQGTIKATIGLGLQARKLAMEAVEDLQDLSAELSADFAMGDTEAQEAAMATQHAAKATQHAGKAAVQAGPKSGARQ